MPLIPALGRQKQEALYEFKASLAYRVSSRASGTKGRPCLKKTNKKYHKLSITNVFKEMYLR